MKAPHMKTSILFREKNNRLQYLTYLSLPGDFSEEYMSMNPTQNRLKDTFFLHSIPAFPAIGELAFAIETSPTQNLCRIVRQKKAVHHIICV